MKNKGIKRSTAEKFLWVIFIIFIAGWIIIASINIKRFNRPIVIVDCGGIDPGFSLLCRGNYGKKVFCVSFTCFPFFPSTEKPFKTGV